MDNKNENFCELSWCEEDIRESLELNDFERSEKNIAIVRAKMEETLLDILIEKGFECIHNIINTSKELE